MKLARVWDAPRPGARVMAAYVDRVFEACVPYAGESVDVQDFYAVAEPTPGGKAPAIDAVRNEADRLYRELEDWRPDSVLTMGSGALNSLARQPRVVAVAKSRGRMRWLNESDSVGGSCAWLPTLNPFAVIKNSDLHRDFASDVYKVMTQRAPIERMRVDITIALTLKGLQDALEVLEGASVIGVDVETTGVRPYRDAMTALGFGAVTGDNEGVAIIVPRDLLEDSKISDTLWDAVWRKTRRTVGHNFKFDMQFMAGHVGWAPKGALVGDTMLLAYLLDERPNNPTSRVRGHGLKEAVATRYDYEYGFDFKETEPEEPEARKTYYAQLHEYLADDCCYTARYWHDLTKEASEESPRILECHDEILMPASKTLAVSEFAGAPIDAGFVVDTIKVLERRIQRRKTALQSSLAWLAKTTTVDNIMAPIQVGRLMYDEWKMTPDVRGKKKSFTGDDYSTDKDHIAAAVAKYLKTDQAAEARWLRSLSLLRRDDKLAKTYQKSVLDRIDDDGRLRASFLLHGTVTGRLSSREPNLQNIPAIDRVDSDKARPLRRAFRPGEGRLWVEADYSQLELRVAAGLSGDTAFAEVFRTGRDIHTEVASAIFRKEPEQVSKAQRFLAKAISFGIIYGRGAKALATGQEMQYAQNELGMKPLTVDEADAFIKLFLKSYPQLHEWIETLHDEVPKQGYVESYFGRRRRFPLTPNNRGELGSIQRQAVNTPVQSAASDLCLRAMTRVQFGIAAFEIDAAVLFPVHDSVCLEVASDQVELLKTLCKREMEEDFLGVPLTIDFEYGSTWADVHA